ncbi:MAG: GNAT family N-acetyltransferase [Candidatus Bipolaricaulia bacterium]
MVEKGEIEEFAAREWAQYNAEVGVNWDSRRYYLAAELGGRAVGLAVFHIVGGVGHLDQLLVAKAHRRQGIGSKLLEEFERFSREEGCHKLTVETAEYQARGFYEGQGFKVACTLRDNKFHRDWHLMEKALFCEDAQGDLDRCRRPTGR